MEICYLREKGWGLPALAEKFNRSQGSIQWCCLMHDAKSPGVDKFDPWTYTQPGYQRAGKKVRYFTKEEDVIVLEDAANGVLIIDTAKKLNRGHSSIIARRAKLIYKSDD